MNIIENFLLKNLKKCEKLNEEVNEILPNMNYREFVEYCESYY